MTRQIKKLYAEYKKAHEATERVELDASEEEFYGALEAECEKFDELVDAIMELAKGQIDEYDLRYVMTSEKFADHFKHFIEMLPAA